MEILVANTINYYRVFLLEYLIQQYNYQIIRVLFVDVTFFEMQKQIFKAIQSDIDINQVLYR